MNEEMHFLKRPEFQLRSLPVRYRWEATRRHPYYTMLWQFACAFHQGRKFGDAEIDEFREIAVHGLYAIGVSGNPPDPSLEFDELVGNQLKSAWLSGAVHPVSFRGLVALLIAHLDQTARNDVGTLLLSIADDVPSSKMKAVTRLIALRHDSLDSGPPEPYVSVNPAASEREISKAIDTLLAEWKRQRGLSQQRVRSDRFDDYLAVWDLREGWAKGVYSRTAELRFAEIAARLKLSKSTIANRYRSAFELITGYPYDPAKWHGLFDLLKFSQLVVQNGKPKVDDRRRRNAQRMPTPESVLGDFSAGQGPVSGAAASDDHATMELWLDLTELIRKGKSDSEIATELDLPLEAIVAFRERYEDGLETGLEK